MVTGLRYQVSLRRRESPCGFAVLAHGIAVDKDERQGFYRDLAVRLAAECT